MGTIEDLAERSSSDPVYWLFVTSDVNHDAPNLRQIVQSYADVVWLHTHESQPRNAGNILNCGLASGVRVEESLLQPWPMFVKRLTDIVAALGALVVLSPLLGLIALAVRFSRGGQFSTHTSELEKLVVYSRHGSFGRWCPTLTKCWTST